MYQHAGIIQKMLTNETFCDKIVGEGINQRVSEWIRAHTVSVNGIQNKLWNVNTQKIRPLTDQPAEGEDVIIYEGVDDKFAFKGNAPVEKREIFGIVKYALNVLSTMANILDIRTMSRRK